MTGRVGVLELSLEKDVARLSRQRREDFAGAGNEPVQLEREKRASSRSTTFLFRETNVGKCAGRPARSLWCKSTSMKE